jgi:hypothetical protein
MTIDTLKSRHYEPLPSEVASNDAHRGSSPIVLAYLYLHPLEKREKKAGLSHLFAKGFEHLDQRIAGQPIFLNEQSALQYSRFMAQDHAILKAYVPEYLIEGHSQSLTLKPGVIQKRHIHGVFPTWDKGRHYIENPYFDARLMLQQKLAQKK